MNISAITLSLLFSGIGLMIAIGSAISKMSDSLIRRLTLFILALLLIGWLVWAISSF